MPKVPQKPDEKTTAIVRSFGANLRDERLRRGLTQDEMAAELDVDPGYYAHWERGRVNITIGTLVMLSEVLEIPVQKLLKIREDLPKAEAKPKRGRPPKKKP